MITRDPTQRLAPSDALALFTATDDAVRTSYASDDINVPWPARCVCGTVRPDNPIPSSYWLHVMTRAHVTWRCGLTLDDLNKVVECRVSYLPGSLYLVRVFILADSSNLATIRLAMLLATGRNGAHAP